MSYTVLQLIDNAYFVTGIVAREFQQVTGPQEAIGLSCLNELLSDKRVETDMVPYYSEYNFTAVIGQEAYFVQDLIDIDTITFTIDSIRYSMLRLDRRAYFETPRANNIESLPIQYHVERLRNGANVYLYFLPDQAYPFKIWGRFGITDVSVNQDLLLSYDAFYINYLKYALADRLCLNFDYDVPPKVAKQLQWYQDNIEAQSQQLDMTLKSISTLSRGPALNWAQINIGKAWTAP